MRHSAKHIADRIRLMISTKQFQTGELLPSTRELGLQLEASFHTVRKAYRLLEQEGMVKGHVGRGYEVIRQTTPLDKTQRLETGAGKMRQLIEELIGYGLDESEIETLFEEQLMFQEWPQRIQSSATIAETPELALMISEAIRRELGVRTSSEGMHFLPADGGDVLEYDALFVPTHLYGKYRALEDEVKVVPVLFTFDLDVIIALSERHATETIGLVASEDATIPLLMESLRSSVQIPGSFVAGATYGRSLPLFVRNTDLILYTAGSAKLIEPKVPESSRLQLTYSLSEKSSEAIRTILWDQ
jgi:GntR family transcriptional regulator